MTAVSTAETTSKTNTINSPNKVLKTQPKLKNMIDKPKMVISLQIKINKICPDEYEMLQNDKKSKINPTVRKNSTGKKLRLIIRTISF